MLCSTFAALLNSDKPALEKFINTCKHMKWNGLEIVAAVISSQVFFSYKAIEDKVALALCISCSVGACNQFQQPERAGTPPGQDGSSKD